MSRDLLEIGMYFIRTKLSKYYTIVSQMEMKPNKCLRITLERAISTFFQDYV